MTGSAVTAPEALRNLRVLVPRPSPQGDGLAAEIRRLGGEALHFPVVETVLPESFEELDAVLLNLEHYALAVVVSVAAANAVSSRIDTLGLALPDSILVASVGPVTSEALRRRGLRVDIEPERDFTSEGLLQALEHVDLSGRRVAIFRGQTGREMLAIRFERVGGRVDRITSYRRRITDRPFRPVIEIWESRGFDAVIVTSNAILDALLQLLGARNRHLIESARVLAISPRIAEYCKRSGIVDVIVSKPGNGPVIDSLSRLPRR